MIFDNTLSQLEPLLSEIGHHEFMCVLPDGTDVYVEFTVEDEIDLTGDGDYRQGIFPRIETVTVCDSEEDAGNGDVNVEKTEILRGLIEGMIETI